ncbi:hypothetical protein [Chroococcidiopsis sp.]|uniref:hypothetical protein n=1 Tax=Chroococcidiopsis sp. TaxID=3088168 RepID=UPI003F3A2E87
MSVSLNFQQQSSRKLGSREQGAGSSYFSPSATLRSATLSSSPHSGLRPASLTLLTPNSSYS